ncbi:MAG: hypothetical protein ACLQIB_40755 [Isosphaeraceae bacterium]
MHGWASEGKARRTHNRSGVIALFFAVMHAAIWLGCFVVAAAITEVTRTELIEGALPLGPLSLRYMQFANFVKGSHPLALLGLGAILAAVDFAAIYAVSGRSRLAEVARGLWSTLVSVVPLVVLALALIALDLPFRAITMSRSKVLEHERQIDSHLKDQLIGTWVATSVRKTDEAGSTTPAVTISFLHVVGTFPDLRAESSGESILRPARRAQRPDEAGDEQVTVEKCWREGSLSNRGPISMGPAVRTGKPTIAKSTSAGYHDHQFRCL